MRELKFRFYGEFEGFEYDYDSPHPKSMIYGDKLGFSLYAPINELMNDKNFIVMQYTGLTDKNGVEIYDGDVVENEFGKKVVKWENFGFIYEEEDTKFQTFLWVLKPEKIEVIGNIYENPELLKN